MIKFYRLIRKVKWKITHTYQRQHTTKIIYSLPSVVNSILCRKHRFGLLWEPSKCSISTGLETTKKPIDSLRRKKLVNLRGYRVGRNGTNFKPCQELAEVVLLWSVAMRKEQQSHHSCAVFPRNGVFNIVFYRWSLIHVQVRTSVSQTI